MSFSIYNNGMKPNVGTNYSIKSGSASSAGSAAVEEQKDSTMVYYAPMPPLKAAPKKGDPDVPPTGKPASSKTGSSNSAGSTSKTGSSGSAGSTGSSGSTGSTGSSGSTSTGNVSQAEYDAAEDAWMANYVKLQEKYGTDYSKWPDSAKNEVEDGQKALDSLKERVR